MLHGIVMVQWFFECIARHHTLLNTPVGLMVILLGMPRVRLSDAQVLSRLGHCGSRIMVKFHDDKWL